MKPSTIFSAVFVVIAVVLAVVIVNQYRFSQRMLVAQGKIVGNVSMYHGHIGISKAATYNVVISYDYKVNDEILRGRRLSLNGNSFASREEAEKIVKLMQQGDSIKVWYDPENPRHSVVLEPRVEMKIFLYFFGCLLLAYLSKQYLDGVLCYISLLKRK